LEKTVFLMEIRGLKKMLAGCRRYGIRLDHAIQAPDMSERGLHRRKTWLIFLKSPCFGYM
jgi:hypothetical protein